MGGQARWTVAAETTAEQDVCLGSKQAGIGTPGQARMLPSIPLSLMAWLVWPERIILPIQFTGLFNTFSMLPQPVLG